MSARLPALLALGGVVVAAVVAGQAGDETPTLARAGAEPGVQAPAVPPADVLSSTWYCAAGTGTDGGMADHVVVISNPSDRDVRATVAVYAGEVASSSPDPRAADEAAADPDDGERGGRQRGGPSGGGAGADEADGDEADEDADEDASTSATGDDEADGDEADEDADEDASTSATGDDGADADEGASTTGGGNGIGDPWSPHDDTAGGGAGGGEAAAPAQPTRAVDVPPGGRVAVRLADIHESPLAAALVEADGQVVVEHEVSGDAGRDVGPCASSAAPQWHLAWGATTRDARELIVLFNPFPSPVTVDVRFATDDGVREPVRYQGFPVPAGEVVALDIGDDVTRREQVAATVTTRSGAIVVERLQTFNGAIGAGGLATTLGVPEPLDTWVFAHGRLGPGRGERIVLYNPTRQRAEIDVSVLPSPREEGAEVTPPQPFGVVVAPGRYEILDYGEEERVTHSAGHATVVRSRNGVPVVAERVLTYEREDGRYQDLSASPGAAFAATMWVQATTGGGNRPQGRLVVFNPDPDRPTRVTVSDTRDGREVAVEGLSDLEVAPGGRREILLPGDLTAADAGVVLRAETPVVVDRFLMSAGGLGQAVAPLVPDSASAVSLSRLDLG